MRHAVGARIIRVDDGGDRGRAVRFVSMESLKLSGVLAILVNINSGILFFGARDV